MKIINQVNKEGCSFKKIIDNIAEKIGALATITNVFETEVYWIEYTKQTCVIAYKVAYITPGTPINKKAWIVFFL